MGAFSPNPLTDGMAWSGFDRAKLPGGAEAVFRAIGVPLSIVDRPGARIPFRQYVAYFEVMARLGGDADFGHRFGLQTRAVQSGIPGHLILNARSFRDGICGHVRTLPTLAQGLRIELVEDRDPPAILWSVASDVGKATQFMRFVKPTWYACYGPIVEANGVCGVSSTPRRRHDGPDSTPRNWAVRLSSMRLSMRSR
jgi:hypothetical protein